jgi:hypothetical protein
MAYYSYLITVGTNLKDGYEFRTRRSPKVRATC